MSLPFVEILLISIRICFIFSPHHFLWFRPSFRLSFHFFVFFIHYCCVFFAGIAHIREAGF